MKIMNLGDDGFVFKNSGINLRAKVKNNHQNLAKYNADS